MRPILRLLAFAGVSQMLTGCPDDGFNPDLMYDSGRDSSRRNNDTALIDTGDTDTDLPPDPCDVESVQRAHLVLDGNGANDLMDAFCAGSNVLDGDLTVNRVNTIVRLDCLCRVTGDLKVESSGVINLAGLHNLRAIGGALVVADNDALLSLDGLNRLTDVQAISIQRNPDLTDLLALSNVAALPANLELIDLPSLADLSGLSSLTSVGGNVAIQRTGADAFSGLSNLHTVTGNVHATGNPGLTTLGLTNLRTVGGSFILDGAPLLTDASSLAGIDTVVGDFAIIGAPTLTSLDLSGLTTVGQVSLRDVGLTSLVWPFVTSGRLTLDGVELADLTDLSHVTAFTSLTLRNADLLTNLNDLQALTTIGSDLTISGNAALVDITGLHGLTAIGRDLTVENNPGFTNSDAQALVDEIGAGHVGGSVLIQGNGP